MPLRRRLIPVFSSFVLLLILIPSLTAAQTVRPVARVILTVVDPSGAIVADATVNVVGLEDATRAAVPKPMKSSEKGVVTLESLPPGRYSFQAEFPGFDLGLLRDVRVRAGDNRHVIVLPLKKMQDAVTVGTDKQAVGADRTRMTFGTTLTAAEIQALSDDPEELRRQLEELAGPDAIFRVDSFEGAALPAKSQIKSIHVTRDQFAAETETPGSTFVEIITQAGIGALRGGLNFNFRDNALAARSPFTPTKASGQNRSVGGNIAGTIAREKADFSIAINGNSSFTMPELNVVLPSGQQAEALALRQPSSNLFYSGTFNWAVSRDQTIRFGISGSRFTSENQGVGGYNLPERASSYEENYYSIRLQEAGPLGRRKFINTRLTMNVGEYRQASVTEAPTVIVQDAFTSGGAQQAGRSRSLDYVIASDVDYVRGIHSWRGGVQVRGGLWDSNLNSNYLGTFTFASLADYNAGRPLLFTRSIGDPRVEYADAQIGMYFQDDIRVRRGFTLSPGVRYSVQKRIEDRAAIEPRIGITWAPAANGRTTLRASTGIFHSFMQPFILEQTLRLDGFRQQELTISNPSYPDPGTSPGVVPPTNRYLLGPSYDLQKNVRYSGGVDHTFSPKFRVNVLYNYFHQIRLPRGRNLNPRVNGVRQDPAFANVIEVVTDAEIRRHELFVNFTVNPMAGSPASPRTFDLRRWTLNGNFASLDAKRNAAGPFSVPPSGTNDTEWGRGPADMPYRLFLSFVSTQVRSLTVNLSIQATDGQPYMHTTGIDNNQDGLLNDRPAGVGLLSLRGSKQTTANLRLAYAFTAGVRPPVATAGAQAPAAPAPRFRVNVFLNIGNVLNRRNYGGFSGTETSPFFLQPTRVNGMRRADMGMNISF
jgi:hypothetical protein